MAVNKLCARDTTSDAKNLAPSTTAKSNLRRQFWVEEKNDFMLFGKGEQSGLMPQKLCPHCGDMRIPIIMFRGLVADRD